MAEITGLDFDAIPEIPDGTYTARLDSVSAEDGKDRDGKPTVFLRWKFTLNVDGEPVAYDALSSTKSGPKSKSFKFAKGLLGQDPTGQHLEFADLVGKKATAVIETVTKTDGSQWPAITNLLPLPKKKPTPPPPPVDETDDDDDGSPS